MDASTPHRPNRFEIDLGAIAHNLSQVRALVGSAVQIVTALKADAYGFGLLPVANTVVAGGADAIAVADLADAAALRADGIEVPILLYAGHLIDATTVNAIERHRVMPTLFDVRSAEALAALVRAPVPVFVKIDVGLERLGVIPQQADALISRILELPNLTLRGVYTHVDVPESPQAEAYVAWQLERYAGTCAALQARGVDIPMKMAASSAVLRCSPVSSFDAVDPGHLLFGLTPPGPVEVELDLRPALVALTSQLIHVRALQRTEFTDLAPFPVTPGMRFGVMPIGLRDGMASLTCGEVLVRGQRAPILGAVSLEHTRIDLSAIPEAEVGDEVVIIGRQGSGEIAPQEIIDRQGFGVQAALGLAVRSSVPRSYRGP